MLIFIEIFGISIPIQRLQKKKFGEKIAFPRTVRRIYENCFCLSLTGKLRELCKAAN